MLFKLNVDSEINLVFLHESLVTELFNFIDSDRKYLNVWLSWLSFIKEINDFNSFIKKLITYAFDELKMEKVEISIAFKNYSSRSVCECLEFKGEGIITNSEDLHSKIVDHIIYDLYNNK